MSPDDPTPAGSEGPGAATFQRVAALFEHARGLATDEREAWLRSEAGDESEVLAEVLRLLGHHDSGDAAVDQLGETWRDLLAEGGAVGPYTILRELGAGGMGVVYLAEQREPLERSVALKVIRAGLRGPEVASRFARERQTLARLAHPGIAQVLDAGTTEDGRPYVALEYVDGEPVHTYCRTNDLGLGARLGLFIDVCRAVEFAHQKGVIHRDLKPGNVLVTEVDGRPVPKVIDFGIAKVVDDEEAALAELTELTVAGSVIGTPAYMSPEQALLGSGDLDTRTDIYSLGVILYELLAGVLPFDPEKLRTAGPVELRRIFAEDDPKPPSTRVREAGSVQARSFAPRLAGDLDWITMKALAKERDRRYSSAGAFADDVGRYLADEPVEARPPSRAYRLSKFARRHRVGLTAAALLLVTLIAGLVTSTVLFIQAEDAREVAEGATKEAEDARALAEKRLADVERTADLQKLATLTAEAEELWPAHPRLEGAMRAWLERAGELLGRMPDYERQLTELRAQGTQAARTADDETVRALELLRREELAKLRDAASYIPGSAMTSPGDDVDPNPLAFYARHTFYLDELPTRPLRFRLHAFDGAVVYLNGKVLAFINVPAVNVGHDTPASGPPPQRNLTGPVEPSLLRSGKNVLAVSIHLRERGRQRMQLTFDMDGPRGTHLVPLDAMWQVQDPSETPVEGWQRSETEVDWPRYQGPVGFTPIHLYPPPVRASAERMRQEIAAVRAKKKPLEEELAKRIDWRFEDAEAQAVHDELERLVRAYEAFMAEEPEGPWVSVSARLQNALALKVHRFASGLVHFNPPPVDRWDTVREELAADKRFDGFELKRQVGLIPLGKDRVSGLQEFAVWGSGETPTRGEDGVLVHHDTDRAIVLVLIPGGPAKLGAGRPGPGGGAPSIGPHIDPMAAPSEGPVHEVVLEPFFLSKYELTQGQWQRLMGENPSSWPVGRQAAGKTVTTQNPVESVPWPEARRGLKRLGLVLPTEAQWEHAVRAGTTTPWWCGESQLSIIGNLNIADVSAMKNRESWASKGWKELDDGYVIHAPVGTFPPNPWGLHETLGNVREWCLDRYGTYLGPVRPGDGLRVEFYDPDLIVTRGGSYSSRVIHSRVTSRGRVRAELAETWVGIRPARTVEK